MDKNEAIINYLMQCPSVKNNPLFFNFATVKDDNKQLLTTANDKVVNKPFVDGSVQKRYTFTIINYKSVIYQALVKEPGYPNENVEDLLDVQSIIDWVTEQNKKRNFPDFGADYTVDEILALTDNPTLNGVDTSVQPPLAKYSISIQVNYLDRTEVLWK